MLILSPNFTRRGLLELLSAGVGVFAVGGLASCADKFPDYRYKMTIYAGRKSFSSVRSTQEREVTSMVDSAGQRVERTLTGEAVIIELEGRTYYALLSMPDNADYASMIQGAALARQIPADKPKTEAEEAIGEYREDKRRAAYPGYYLDDIASRSRAMTKVVGPKDLPRTLPPREGRPPFQAWPMFVTFDNPNDPKTVREVTPEAIGVGRITIEITDEPVTRGIMERLSWLPTYSDRMLDGRKTHNSNQLSNNLGSNAFAQGTT